MLRPGLIAFLFLSTVAARSQENYEIQVYASPTMNKGMTMFELHSNYTLNGTKIVAPDGALPTNNVWHETVEITHGWTSNFETGFYFFNAIGSNGRTAYVGSHIRPRITAPANWHWPVGVSLSTEFGFQKARFDPNTCTLEIRPIIDKLWDRLYLALNPTIEKSFNGPDEHIGFVFAPNVKASYKTGNVVALGLEYYGSTGRFFHYDRLADQDHQLFAAADFTFDPRWELNAGLGWGLSQPDDKAIAKLIVGRRF